MQKKIRTILDTSYAQYLQLRAILAALINAGATVLLVGGAVRDALLGCAVKDLDFEIYHFSLQQLESVLVQFGTVKVVGKSFGVLRVHGLDIDFSIPRADSAGRKPDVVVDPYMSYEDAFRRRDLTINAMGFNVETYELIDPYNGQKDLEQKMLRAPDNKTFIEDPLRFFRVMQFVGRFQMSVAPELHQLCQKMDLLQLSRDRIEKEFEKLVLKSKRPSLGIRWLYDVGRLDELLPELFAIIGVPQREDYHPEGDVFEHSMQVLDAAANLVATYKTDEEKLTLLYAGLCHDLGKKEVTTWVDGRWRSIGHAEAGAPLAKLLLSRITGKKKIISHVATLTYYHMEPGTYVASGAKQATYKMLAHKLGSDVSLATLSDLFCIDRQGRNGQSSEPFTHVDDDVVLFRQKAESAGVLHAVEQPILTGVDFLDVVDESKQIGDFLSHAYKLQIRHNITDKDELKKRVLRDLR